MDSGREVRKMGEAGYYDLLADFGVPYFHWGGMKATEELMELCGIGAEKRALAVGCGTGYSACHVAEKYGCRVVGVDIAENMVAKAEERSREMGLADRAEFRVDNAHDLGFEDASFDIVTTEFVTVFLEREAALEEYVRVLVPGGFVGVNELYKAEDIPEREAEIIAEAQRSFEEASGLPLNMPTQTEWRRLFEGAGLEDVLIREIGYTYGYREYIGAVGGPTNTLKMILKAFDIMLRNGELRERFMKVGRLKRVIMQDRKTSRYAGAMLCVGRKPL